jgi:hypothetical protein
VKSKRKRRGQAVKIVLLIGALAIPVLLGGCADVQYANDGVRSPEAKYDTYYAPHYYPYYPWSGYYGGAYYYGE